MNSGTIVYEKNADDKVYPASLTKIMTCMLALELCKDLAEEVTVTETALAGLDPDGSTASLQVGEVPTMEDLLYCIMLPPQTTPAASSRNTWAARLTPLWKK